MPAHSAKRARGIEKAQRLLYAAPEAGYQLSVSTTQVWRLIKAGQLRPTKIGKRVLLSHAELLRFIAASTGAQA